MKQDVENLIVKYKNAIKDGTADYKIYTKLASLYSKKAEQKIKVLRKNNDSGHDEEIEKLLNSSQELLQKAMSIAIKKSLEDRERPS